MFGTYFKLYEKLSGWLSRHSKNAIHDYYSNLNKTYISILNEQFKDNERIISIKKIIYDKRNNWEELKNWLLLGEKH